jgi:hypothetical protein
VWASYLPQQFHPSSTVTAANYLRPHAAGRMEHKEVAMTRRVRRWVAAAVAVAATGLMVGRTIAATTGVNQCWSRGFSRPVRTFEVSGLDSARVTS